jgi:branched-chain amino acid transport system ATP-binding protein
MSAILEAQGVSKHFGGLKAVGNVSMRVEQGEIFGIIGPNGAGKTTLFNVCSGFYKPTAGRISFRGQDITGKPPETIARLGISRTFQNIRLFRYMTVLENVKIGFHVRTTVGMASAILRNRRFVEEERSIEGQALDIVRQVGLAEHGDTLASNLAYGLQRRVEIARALAIQPGLLLLDEPVAGMNPNETRELSGFLKTLNSQGYTIVVIEHDMSFVMKTCSRILVLNFGEEIAQGTPDTVSRDPAVAEAYFGKGLAMGKRP